MSKLIEIMHLIPGILKLILTSMTIFLASSIDDLIVLTLHLASKSHKKNKFSQKEISYGYFIGIFILVFLSLFVSVPMMGISYKYLGFLGLIPIYRGVALLLHINKEVSTFVELPDHKFVDFLKNYFSPNLLIMVAITLVNGGDNVSMYIPFFSSIKYYVILIVPLFFVYNYYWLKLSQKLVELKQINYVLSKHGNKIVPYLMIGVGIYIILRNGTLTYLLR